MAQISKTAMWIDQNGREVMVFFFLFLAGSVGGMIVDVSYLTPRMIEETVAAGEEPGPGTVSFYGALTGIMLSIGLSSVYHFINKYKQMEDTAEYIKTYGSTRYIHFIAVNKYGQGVYNGKISLDVIDNISISTEQRMAFQNTKRFAEAMDYVASQNADSMEIDTESEERLAAVTTHVAGSEDSEVPEFYKDRFLTFADEVVLFEILRMAPYGMTKEFKNLYYNVDNAPDYANTEDETLELPYQEYVDYVICDPEMKAVDRINFLRTSLYKDFENGRQIEKQSFSDLGIDGNESLRVSGRHEMEYDVEARIRANHQKFQVMGIISVIIGVFAAIINSAVPAAQPVGWLWIVLPVTVATLFFLYYAGREKKIQGEIAERKRPVVNLEFKEPIEAGSAKSLNRVMSMGVSLFETYGFNFHLYQVKTKVERFKERFGTDTMYVVLPSTWENCFETTKQTIFVPGREHIMLPSARVTHGYFNQIGVANGCPVMYGSGTGYVSTKNLAALRDPEFLNSLIVNTYIHLLGEAQAMSVSAETSLSSEQVKTRVYESDFIKQRIDNDELVRKIQRGDAPEGVLINPRQLSPKYSETVRKLASDIWPLWKKVLVGVGLLVGGAVLTYLVMVGGA